MSKSETNTAGEVEDQIDPQPDTTAETSAAQVAAMTPTPYWSGPSGVFIAY